MAPVTTFHPAPRVPAPLRSAVPSKRFTPVAGRRIEDRPGPAPSRVDVDEQGVLVLEGQKDLTPTWLYGTILSVCLIGFFFSFVWWASASDIMTALWRFAFLVLMVVFAFVGIVVSIRVSRKENLPAKAKVVAARKAHGARRFAARRAHGAQAYARRRKQGMVQLVHQTRSSVKQTGSSLRASGTHFREGFHGESEPNFLVKMLRGVIRFVVWVYVKLERLVLFVFRLLVGVFRLVYWVYVLVVRLAWALYRGLVEPVLVTAYKAARWVVGAAYFTARGTLRLAWRIVYWLVRRWPLVYATQALEAPVRVHVVPPMYAADVFVSEFLRVKTRPVVLESAKPTVQARRLAFRTRRAESLLELHEVREEELAARAVVIPPEERWRRWRQQRKQKRQELKAQREAAKQAELDEKAAERARKEARKEAEADYKKRLKAAKKAGTKLSQEEKKALELEVLKEYLGEEAVQELRPETRNPAKEVAPAAAAAQEPEDQDADKQREKEEKKRQKEEARRAKQEKAHEKKELKREKQAHKQAEKDVKPILKGRLRKMKKEGRKLTKEETRELEVDLIEDLVAKALGREPRKKEAVAPTQPEEAHEMGPEEGTSPKERKRLEKEEKQRAKDQEKRARQEEKKRQQEEKAQAKKGKARKKGKGEDEGEEVTSVSGQGGGGA